MCYEVTKQTVASSWDIKAGCMSEDHERGEEMNLGKEKIFGVLAGGAIGDALGAIAEGVPREEMEKRHKGFIENYGELQDFEWYENHPELVAKFWRMGCLHTDDTQMALAVIDCFLKHGRLKEKELAVCFQELFPVARGVGKGYRTFYQNMKKNIWPAALLNNAGSGSAMRAGVIAVLPMKFVHFEIFTNALSQSRVTNTDIRSHWASILIALTTLTFAMIDYDESIVFDHTIPEFVLKMMEEKKELVRSLVENESDFDNFEEKTAQFFESIKIIIKFLTANPSAPRNTEVYQMLIHLIAEHACKYKNTAAASSTGTRNFVLEAPVTSFATAIFFGHHFPKAIMNAIHLGGDTDTVASMVGQIVGAYHGFDLDVWDVNTSDGNINITPINDNSEQDIGIPLNWFLPLKVKWQLFHRTMCLAGITTYEMPSLFGVAGTEEDKQLRDLVAFEKEWTLMERNKKKLIQEHFGNLSHYKREELPREVIGIRR